MLKKQFLKAKVLFAILLLLQFGVHAQLKTITGSVKDDKGSPLAKATVTPKGAKEGVTTKDDGTFSISVPTTTAALTISFTGFDTKDVDIKDKSDVSVVLATEIKKLEDVVVNVGYQTQRVKDVTGAVSQVKGDAIKNLPTQDVATALQGRVAGVEVVTASGQPGVSSQITIRGVSSLNNSNPLYVIDGVQQKGPDPGNNINPQDIESISVLKDAAAAAIYGASAAGGVIIITTKRGKGAQPSIDFGMRYGSTTPLLVSLLDGKDFLTYEKDVHGGYFSNSSNAAEIDTLKSIDWSKELYRNGTEQNYYLSISGASPNVNYYLSGIYNTQEGIFLDNQSSLAGARINTDVKITNSVKVGEQLNVWRRSTVPVKTSVVSTPFETQPLFTGPAYSLTPGGAYGIYPFPYDGLNPVAQIKSASFDFPETNFQGQAYLEAKLPVRYLTFRATFGYTSQSYENDLYYSNLQASGQPTYNPDGSLANSLYRNKGTYQQTLIAYILAYDHAWGKHTINLLAGYEQYANQTENLQTNVTNVLGTSYGYIIGSSSTQSVMGSYDPNGLVKSVFGRIHYNYNQKYDLEFIIRQDANFTVFAPNYQAAVFPGISGAWNINEEHFFKKFRPILSSLKLRGGYGELGNSSIPPYKFISQYGQVASQNFYPNNSALVGYTQNTLANPYIQWESTHETNIGTDGELLNGKIYFSIDWYIKNTTKLLYNVPVAISSGISPSGNPAIGTLMPGIFVDNIGEVRNKGVDISIGYKGNHKQFNYSVGVTGTFNNNKVLSLNNIAPFEDGSASYPYGAISPWSGNALTYTEVGQPFGQFYGLKALGIYRANDPRLANAPTYNGDSAHAGDLIFYDKNHDGKITPADDTLIGNPYPKFTFGVNITANWKNFDIAILFSGALGVDLYNGVAPYEFENLDNSNVTSKVFQTSGFVNNGKANGITQYPSVYNFNTSVQDPYGNYTQPSSYFVENGSYVKLKNLQIGYSLSSRLLQRFKIKTLRIYVMGNNLFAITKYTGVDPELGSQFSNLSVAPDGKVNGNLNGTSSATNGGATNRGIDYPGKYPSVRLYAAGLDLSF
jgi:TonB-dependent starch-binding outer membrane protein SusC